MEELLIATMLVLFGHYFGAILIYLNHRFIFHTKIGNLPFLRQAKKLHAMHHAHAYDESRNKYIFIPIPIQLLLFAIILSFGIFINLYFAVGIASFAMLYSYRHHEIHNNDRSSKFYKHHKLHHINPRYNFSGIYPAIDDIFRTTLKKKQ